MSRIADIVAELMKHPRELYNTFDKGSTGKNIRHDRDSIVKAITQSFPAMAKDPQQASIDDLLAFGAVGVGTLKGAKPTQFSKAHELAQKNAAKSWQEGGLNLPANNTAMDRARALGFDTRPSSQVYHSSRKEWDGNEIDPSLSDLGFHVGTLDQAENRLRAFGSNGVNLDAEGGNIIPIVKSKYSYMLPVKDEGSFHADSIAPQLEKKKLLSKGYTKKILNDPLGDSDPRQWDKVYDAKMRDVLTQEGYHGVKYKNAQEGEGMSYAFTEPSMIRSRFAAFDPMNRNSSNLLASGLIGSLLLNQDDR